MRRAFLQSSVLLCCALLASLAGCDGNFKPGLAPGTRAPSFPTKTLADVGGDFSKVTTYRQPDARMYQYSVDQALQIGKPIVLEFATPGHCTVCDGQLQMLKALVDQYQGQVIFIHLDQYQNPQAFKAFQVIGDPWTFVIDKNGIVQFQQPGRMLFGEMEAAVKKVLPM
jgi:thiol-disulfide isomerase/thioredoxin